ncbi:hypothetical protein P175DRAFT_0515404 [Aspergillus ochraceoroseus IBT 24754]|uniref:FAD/NAD(P)-binding domain-containing protein n=1 Tax=Aspergillus ochraceoroseus IBT 24754 TaxID=1392256 RepID=A0A2T5M4W7_9EURO|nr:uncharacterized protein P175DRAFT_0515404 [Aspergillus ochraceoroseus IBT 24754]PTU23546.1 hypothetical protein P175DRAFT_0515404 [Aspergillus ochraceoroseus IBT 24754]
MTTLKNIIVVGGSYVGKSTAQELARIVPHTHRVLLVEPHSHFHHLFAFPRFAIGSGHEHKAFIPYTGLFSSVSPAAHHAVVQARVLSVQPQYVQLDREWEGSGQVPFEYLVVATGTRLAEPAGMRDDDKLSSVAYLQKHQAAVKQAKSIVVVGGGAVGVQMAADLKEYYPEKDVTVVHSRTHLMPQFHPDLHYLIKDRFDELGVKLVTSSRVKIPRAGFPNNGTPFDVELADGSIIPSADFVILATGQKPNTSLLDHLPLSAPGSLINPDSGFIRIRPTMQFADEQYPNLFAVGDIADTGLRKAARPGSAQAGVVARNILAMVEGKTPEEQFPHWPAAIHLSLGLKYNVVFRDPNPAEGQTEPTVDRRDDGREDMGVAGWWERLGVAVKNLSEYHL